MSRSRSEMVESSMRRTCPRISWLLLLKVCLSSEPMRACITPRFDMPVECLRCGSRSKPVFTTPVLEVPIDLATAVRTGPDGRAWVGITSATGFSQEGHLLESWLLNICDQDIVSVDDLPTTTTSLRIAPSPADQQATVTLPSTLAGDWTLRVVSMDGRTVFTADGA